MLAPGVAVVALGAIVVIGGGVTWMLDIVITALALGWGGALILVGRSYDASEERRAAELRDERSARAQLVAKRFGPGREPQRERSGRSTQP